MAYLNIADHREERMPRAEIKSALRAQGFQAALADQVADLAIHAANRAMDALIETAGTGQDAGGVRLNALSIGLAVLKSEIAILEGAMAFATKATGCRTIDATVSVGGQAHG